MTNENDPAFSIFIGLTKREYFAAMAMQGLCMNHKWAENIVQDDWDDFVERVTSGSKDLADALINELNKPL